MKTNDVQWQAEVEYEERLLVLHARDTQLDDHLEIESNNSVEFLHSCRLVLLFLCYSLVYDIVLVMLVDNDDVDCLIREYQVEFSKKFENVQVQYRFVPMVVDAQDTAQVKRWTNVSV